MNFSASMGGTRLIRYSLCGNKQPSNDGPRGRSGGRRLACRGWGSERQTGYFYLSIPSGSCYNVSMICALLPHVDLGLGGADHQAIKLRAHALDRVDVDAIAARDAGLGLPDLEPGAHFLLWRQLERIARSFHDPPD